MVVAADSVWAVFAVEGVVEVDIRSHLQGPRQGALDAVEVRSLARRPQERRLGQVRRLMPGPAARSPPVPTARASPGPPRPWSSCAMISWPGSEPGGTGA